MVADIVSWTLVMALPGPDIVAIGTQVSRHGHRAGLAAAAGAAAGVALWSALSLLGISAIVASIPALGVVLPALGSVVLILLGVWALITSRTPSPHPEQAVLPEQDASPGQDAATTAPAQVADSSSSTSATAPGEVWRSFRLGLVTNLSNPKALVFFISFFTPMMASYDGATAKALILAVLLTVTLAIFSTMSVLIRAASASPLARAPFLRFVPGTIFILIGAYYLAETLTG